MDNFLYKEKLAVEHRRDQMEKAAQYNRLNPPTRKKFSLSIYRMGKHLKKMGFRMQERYAYLAYRGEYKKAVKLGQISIP